MRAAVIFGLGSYEKDLKPFQQVSPHDSQIGMPAHSSEADAILIFGGDGTVHRHLAQLVKLQLPVLVVPCGSGNDFARALGLRSAKDSLAAWRKFASGQGKTRALDLGVIHDFQAPAPHEHYFCCVGGVGLDAEVARRANSLPRWLRGHGGYALSLVPGLLSFAPLPMRISTAEGGEPFNLCSDKPTVLAAFANTPVYGGGMKIAPRAQFDDGKLDLCIITDVDRFKLFCLFPTVYFGKHLKMPEVEYLQTERVRVETENPLDVYADGEYVCRTPIEVSVLRGGLRVITA